jgi:uncharacterized protein (TIRG00374 family)
MFYGFDIDKIDFSMFSFVGILTAVLTIVLAQVILSLRWMNISKMSFKVSLETVIVSSALNMILPGRLGELSKAVYLKKFYNYTYHKVMSILFVERFFDIVALFLIMCLWAYNYLSNDIIKNSIFMLTFFIIFIILFFKSKVIFSILKKIPFRFIRIYSQKIYKIIKKLLDNPFYIFLYTVVLWFFYFISTVLFFMQAVDFGLDFGTVFELFIFSTIAMAIPMAPAGLGTYEGVVVLFLTHHGVGKEDALMSALLYHILLFAVYLISLYFFLLIKNIKLKDLIK